MPRREFTKAVRVAIIKRATRVDERGMSRVYCEGCGLPAARWEVDHTTPDGLHIDKSKPLTAAEGKVLCAGSPDTCHGKKTPQDVAKIAKAKRNEAKHLRVNDGLGQLGVPRAAKVARKEAQSADRRGGKIDFTQRRPMFEDCA